MKFLLLTCYLFFFSLPLVAQTDLIKFSLPNNRVLTITAHPDYPPIIWVDKKTNQFQGIAVELLQKILKEVNIEAKFINVETWARAQEEVKNGRIDMLVPPYKTNERVQFYNYFTEPFLMDSTVVFVKKGTEFTFNELSDLFKHPGVAIVNDSFGSEFDALEKKQSHLTRLTSTEQCFRFVDKGRARYVVAGFHSGMMTLEKMNLSETFTYLPKRIIVTGMYAPISLKSPWNIPEVNEFLKRKFNEYNQKGIVKQLEKKYLSILKKELKQKH